MPVIVLYIPHVVTFPSMARESLEHGLENYGRPALQGPFMLLQLPSESPSPLLHPSHSWGHTRSRDRPSSLAKHISQICITDERDSRPWLHSPDLFPRSPNHAHPKLHQRRRDRTSASPRVRDHIPSLTT